MVRTKKQVENLLRHLIIHNITILASLEDSRNELRSKKLSLWMHDPVNSMIVDLMQDLRVALMPVVGMVEKEYKSRPDRLLIIKAIKESKEKECHCVACGDNKI